MVLPKTTVLPNDPTQARSVFLQKLQSATVLFVVLGDDATAQGLLSDASRLAGAEDDPRWVISAPRPADILPTVATLDSKSPGLKQAIAGGTALAFTTSVEQQIRDVITLGEPTDDFRVFQAYLRAEET